MTSDEIVAFFLDGDNPYFERIVDAETETEALGIADEALTKYGARVEPSLLLMAVSQMRES